MLQLDEYTYNEHHHTSPSSASNTTSLAATLTPGTPTAIEDDSLKRLSLNSVNLTSLSRSSNTLPGPPSSTASESCNSDSSLLSSVGMTPDEDEEEEDDYQYDDDLDDDDDMYGSEMRHQRAKEAAKILLSQCLLEDNPRYYSDSFSKTSRLGLAPITLLLNPETPCPTKIIPLPDSSTTSSISSSYSLSDDCPSSSEEEQEAYDVQEAQAASLFIRLL